MEQLAFDLEIETRELPKKEPKPKPLPIEERIYALYPRKIKKGQALQAIVKALRRATEEEIIAGVEAYAEAVSQWPKDDRKYIPHPATWFNGERWADDREEWNRNNDERTTRGRYDNAW